MQRNDTLHTTAQAAAMAQKPLRVCTDLLQQQTAGARFLLANAGYIRIVLPDFKLHLLLQRPARCGGRSPAPEEMQASDSIGSRIRQGGYAMMLVCTISAFLLIPFARSVNTPYLYIIVAAYWLMNIAYCVKLKQYAILDVAIIAVGFVMRVLIGGLTTDIWVSHWLVMMTFLVTLFLAFTKRNDDYRIYEQTGTKPRVSITGYNKTFINEATAIIASVTMVCYIMYTMSPEVIERMGTRYVYLTSGWVLAGLLRYLQNMIVFGLSGSPTKSIVKDHFVQLCIIGWIASFFVIIYL